jgi:hypothetical protein
MIAAEVYPEEPEIAEKQLQSMRIPDGVITNAWRLIDDYDLEEVLMHIYEECYAVH